MELDPYAELGVTREATAAQIKAARRKKARTLHPDRAKGAPAATREPAL
jgi:molecular chaperone DnaJ